MPDTHLSTHPSAAARKGRKRRPADCRRSNEDAWRLRGGARTSPSTPTIVGPRLGDGQALKTINQFLAGVHIAEPPRPSPSLGVELDPAVDQRAVQGRRGSFMFADRGPRMLQAYTGGVEGEVARRHLREGHGIVTSVGRMCHVPLPLAAAAEQLYLIAEAAGLGAQDDSSVVTVRHPDVKKDIG